MTGEEKKLGLERVKQWPRPEIEWAGKLSGREQQFLVLCAALLDIYPIALIEEGRKE